MHKEDLKVLNLRSQLGAPWYFTLLDHLHGINVDETRSRRQQQHALACKESLALIDESLLEDHFSIGEHVPLVSLLCLQALHLLCVAQIEGI